MKCNDEHDNKVISKSCPSKPGSEVNDLAAGIQTMTVHGSAAKSGQGFLLGSR